MSWAGGATILAMAAAARLVAADHVALGSRQVRLGDVATLIEAGRLAALRGRVIAELPVAGGSIMLSRTAVASLVRRAAPDLIVVAGAPGTITFIAPVRSVRRAPPGSQPRAAVRPVASGVRLTLVSSVGAVTIERSVTTLQPARPGRRVFVRDTDGNVVVACLALGASR